MNGGMSMTEVLRTAVHALRGNWMRSALTSLGVIIGIAAVIVMVSVGQGTQAEIDKLVSGLGSNRLDISPGSGRGFGGIRIGGASNFTLTEEDAAAIRTEIPEVQYVAGSLRATASWCTRRTTGRAAGRACRRTGSTSTAGTSRAAMASTRATTAARRRT
jgi:ABC-type lipoprotein release transport system permease subunit